MATKTNLKKRIQLSDILKGELKRIKNFNFLSTSSIKRIGESVIDQIVDRTTAGFDKRDKRFEGYSPKYKDFRRQHGLQIRYPDLFFTGHMLSNIEITKIFKNGNFTISVDKEDEGKLRGAVEGIKRAKKPKVVRDFWGISKKDADKLSKKITPIVKKDYDKYLKRREKEIK